MDNYDPNPLAIEVKALVNSPTQQPIFAWITVTVASIESVSRAQTPSGGGASIRFTSGITILVSNSYEDVSEAILGDAKRFPEDEAVEAEMLAPREQPEELASSLEEDDLGAFEDIGDLGDIMALASDLDAEVEVDDEAAEEEEL